MLNRGKNVPMTIKDPTGLQTSRDSKQKGTEVSLTVIQKYKSLFTEQKFDFLILSMKVKSFS
jgi:hypothetical protein